MAIYFMSKNKLISRNLNFRMISNKWSNGWVTVRKTSMKTPSTENGPSTLSNFNKKVHQQNNEQNDGGDYNKRSTKKGKFNKIRNYWSWKAGASWTILSVLDWWLLAAGGWLTWEGVLLRWTPIGICLVAAIQWHLHNRKLDRQGLPRTAHKWHIDVYCSLPLRLVSRCWGWLAHREIPIPLRPMVYGLYSSTFGVNIDEAEISDLKYYRSLGEFFTRSLKTEARIIDTESCIVSPADGKVLHFGLASNAQIEQVKGVTYSLNSFLGPADWVPQRKSGLGCYEQTIKHNPSEDTALYQCVIYLAPGDYHRFHSPAEWIPKIRRHFAGELLSVSPKIAKWLPGLFCINERALYIGEWKHGFFSFTAVGATNVGSVKIYIDDELKTNRWIGYKLRAHKPNEYAEAKLPKGICLHKGDLLGQFNMGSTVVIVFEAPKNFQFDLRPGQTIRVGEKLGCLNLIQSL